MYINAAREWLKSAFSLNEYYLTPKDERALRYDKTTWIANRIFNKTFRKAQVHPEARADILKKVKQSIENGLPLHFIACFGGYKHFWNPSYPEVDFAELFNLRFMSEYISPILKAHAPGVVLEYESEDVILTTMDNYPQDDLDRYSQSFRKLIDLYSKTLPANMKINLIRAREQVPADALWKKIDDFLPNIRAEWASLSKEEIELRLSHAPSNIMWKGAEDLTGLSAEEKRRRILESKIINEAYYAADWEFRKDFFTGENHIPLVFWFGKTRDNFGHWLTLGSTHSSMVDFWVGRGILEMRNGKAVERIVSHSQYDMIKGKLETVEAFNGLPLKNFKYIEVGGDLGIGEAQKRNADQPAPQKA